MADTDLAAQPDLTTLTVQLLSAYVANNTVASGDLAGLITSTRAALAGSAPQATASEAPATYEPAVPIRRSTASKDHILSLIDGKPYKTLKRHLAGHGLTPEEYRARYNLPKSYPMVAPSYSQRRREVAEQLGLGRKRVAAVVPAAASAEQPAPAREPAQAKQPVPTKAKRATNGRATPKAASARQPVTAAAPVAPQSEPNKVPVETAAKSRTARRMARPKAEPQPAPAASAPAKPRGRPKKAAPAAATTAAE